MQEEDGGRGVDDRITEAIVGDSVYECLRVERGGLLNRPIPQKLATQSGLLVVLTFVFPISAAFPAPVKALFPAGNPLTASPGITVLGALALALVAVTGALLAVLESVRLRLDAGLTRGQAETILNCEDLASLFGIGTAGAAVLATDALALLGLGGIEIVRTYTEAAFTASGTGITVVALAVGSACGAVCLYTASQYLRLADTAGE